MSNRVSGGRDPLHEFDAFASELVQDLSSRIEGGAHLGAGDVEALYQLAAAVGRDVAGWGADLARLGGAERRPFDPRRATALIAETVFDELLDARAWRVFAAACALPHAAGPE